MTHYAFAPLARAAGARSLSHAALIFGTTGPQVARWHRSGLCAETADRLACRVGLHPTYVWPDWAASVTPIRPPRRRRLLPLELCPGSGGSAPAQARKRAICPQCGTSTAVNPSASTLRRHGRKPAA